MKVNIMTLIDDVHCMNPEIRIPGLITALPQQVHELFSRDSAG